MTQVMKAADQMLMSASSVYTVLPVLLSVVRAVSRPSSSACCCGERVFKERKCDFCTSE